MCNTIGGQARGESVASSKEGPLVPRSAQDRTKAGLRVLVRACFLLASVSSFTPATAEPSLAVTTVLSAERTVTGEPIR